MKKQKLILSEHTINRLGLGWLLREAMDIDSIYQKYYSKIDRKIFDEIVAADPKTIQGVKIGKYAKVLLKLFMDGNLLLEDLPKATKYLELAYKHNVPIDITKVDSLPDIYNLVSRYVVNAESSFQNILDTLLEEDRTHCRTVNTAPEGWMIVIPQTEKAACWLGINTEWCTTYGEHSLDPYYQNRKSLFNSYASKGKLYIVYNTKTEEKYQVHLETESYMDSTDSAIEYEDLPKAVWVAILEDNYGEGYTLWINSGYDTSTIEGLIEIINKFYSKYSRGAFDESRVIELLKNDKGEFDSSYTPPLREIAYYVEDSLFEKILSDAIESGDITEEEVETEGITDFQDLIPYLQGTDVEAQLQQAYNSMYSDTAYQEFYSSVEDWAETLLAENPIKRFLFGVETSELTEIVPPYNGYEGYGSSDVFKDYYLNY